MVSRLLLFISCKAVVVVFILIEILEINSMKVNNIQIIEKDSYKELSAFMDDYRLWYRMPSEYNITLTGDPFLAAGFFPSMVTGETLEIEDGASVSPKLISSAYQLQEIFSCWNPSLKKFKIHANKEIHESINTGTATFFSGGLDGLYTLGKHPNEITHLVYINGFDFEMSPEIFESSAMRIRRIAASFNKVLIPVQTNNYAFMKHHKISRILNFGSCLASVALFLGFAKTFIPAGHTYYELFPHGSHPLTDPLWSSEGMKIIHDGAEAGRIEKTLRLIEDNRFTEHLDNLIVCWNEPNSNCGKCGKCIRTMLTFKILNFKSLAFQRELDLSDVRRITFRDSSYRSYFDDMLEVALNRNERKIASAIKWAIKKNAIKFSIKEFDNQHLGGIVKRLYSLIRGRKYGSALELIQVSSRR